MPIKSSPESLLLSVCGKEAFWHPASMTISMSSLALSPQTQHCNFASIFSSEEALCPWSTPVVNISSPSRFPWNRLSSDFLSRRQPNMRAGKVSHRSHSVGSGSFCYRRAAESKLEDSNKILFHCLIGWVDKRIYKQTSEGTFNLSLNSRGNNSWFYSFIYSLIKTLIYLWLWTNLKILRKEHFHKKCLNEMFSSWDTPKVSLCF